MTESPGFADRSIVRKTIDFNVENIMNGIWIWENSGNKKDEHAEFKASFHVNKGDNVQVNISCDTDFVLYLNGVLGGFGQYPDYPHYKVYETFDVSAIVRPGENILAIEAYHGGECSTH